MKKIVLSCGVLILALVVMVAGCQKSQSGSGPASPAIMSVEKTSFNDVTAQLDPGGDFYMYLGAAQWVSDLSGKLGRWQGKIEAMPDLEPSQLQRIDQAFDVLTNLVKDSGIEDVTGVGMSSVEFEQGMYRNKCIIHHYPGKGDGFIWQFGGRQPHPLDGLDFLPADTGVAIFSDADLPLAWSVIERDVTNANIPEAQQWLQTFRGQFADKTGVPWDQFLHSLGGEFGFVLTLNASNKVAVPLSPSSTAMVPEPGLMLVVKVNDDTIFNRIDQALKTNSQVIAVDKTDVKMRTMPVPLPLPFALRPTAATSGGYLFIASSDDMINEVLEVKAGKKPGLKSTDEFKHLSQNIPDEGNQFVYFSPLVGQTIYDIQKQTMGSSTGQQSGQARWMQSLFQNRPAFGYSVGMGTPTGYVSIGNTSQSYAVAALMPAVALPAVLAAIAVPNFEKARATSQENACINNLRMIDAAKNEWALEKGKTNGAVPTWDDLRPYLAGPVPLACPAGGTYSINAVGEKPMCSIPGHVLP